MKKLHFLFWLVLLHFGFQSKAQNVLISSGGGEAESSALLEVRAPFKGMLIPRMSAVDRLNILSPAQGLLVFQNDGDEAFYYYNGSNWDTLKLSREVNIVTAKTNSDIAVVSDFKDSGENGGTFFSGSWDTRDLNHLAGDSSFISINGSTNFTLDSGIYQLNANAPAKSVGGQQIRLQDISNNQTIALGTIVHSVIASPNSIINTVFQINSPTSFEIQHRCESDRNNSDGKGLGVTWGQSIFTQVRIRKL